MTPHEQVGELAKTAPPVAVTSMTLAGYSMNDWVLTLTAIYTLLQIFIVVRRFLVSRRTTDAIQESDPPCARDCEAARRKQ
ncbi:hypothetical protein AB6Q56_14505 [Dechloromonas sp. ARDL1]|uniref:hypothetical protein n=1 Tax=Dechloromonas sp. ARDL1 TaxID=3322121 RepID=UPI003DA76887